jgi:hypothetical protein
MPDELYQEYLNELAEQHRLSASLNNSSTQALAIAYQSNNCDEIKSIAAALMCLGGMHAPIKQAWEFLRQPKVMSVYPGFGNSFEKGFPQRFNALWNLSIELRLENLPYTVEEIVRFVRAKTNKDIWPNLGFYTALGFVDKHYRDAIGFLIKSRIDEWNNIMKQLDYKTKRV